MPLVLLLVVLALVLRLYRIDHDSFWIDELHHVRVASQAPFDILRNYHITAPRELRDQAPLSFLIAHVALSEQNPELSARLPSALFGACGVLALFAFARQLLPFDISWMAAFFLALSPLDVWYGQEARWYSQWSCLVTLSYVALARASATDSRRAWLAYVLMTVACVYTFILTIFVLAAQATSIWWQRHILDVPERRLLLWRFGPVLVLVLVMSAPVVSLAASHVGLVQTGTPRAPSLLELPYTLYAYSVGYTVGPTLAELHFPSDPVHLLATHLELPALTALFFGVACLGVLGFRNHRPAMVWLAPWLVAPPLMIFLVTLVTELTYQVRYTLASLPAFMVVVAMGVFSLGKKLRPIGVAAILIPFSYSLANLYWVESYDKADIRGALAHIVETDPLVSEIVAVGQVDLALPYYGRYPQIQVIRGCGSEDGLSGDLQRSRTLWVLAARDWERRSGRCLEQLAGDFHATEHESGIGFELWRLEPLPTSGARE